MSSSTIATYGSARRSSFGIRFAAILVVGWWLGYAVAPASAVLFQLINGDDAGEGFNDPLLGASRQAAMQFALDTWGNLLAPAYIGETIRVYAEFNDLGGSPTSATLGYASPSYISDLGSDQLVFPVPLANHYAQQSLIPTDEEYNQYEIAAVFNSTVDDPLVFGSYKWYYGTDENATATDVDFISVVMHEIAHGLGFGSAIQSDGSYAPFLNTALPSVYDYFLALGPSEDDLLLDMATDAERAAAIRSDNLYWAGDEARAANGGAYPKVNAPGTYTPGSSLVHLADDGFAFDLMSATFSFGEVNRMPSAVDIGMLRDMGWNFSTVPEPGSLTLAGAVAVAAGVRRWRQRATTHAA